VSEGPSIAERYHEETKYTPERIAASNRQLDFDNKPELWKDYSGSEVISLAPHLGLAGPTLADALAAMPLPPLASPDPGLAQLARLLFFTNGVTRVVPQPEGPPFLMRAAPSAGGLYPTEVYVVSPPDRGPDSLPAGVWNFDNRDLSLAHVGQQLFAFDAIARATAVPQVLEKAKFLVVLTGVFWRSAWRYEERAYRRILLDTGHVLGNLVIAAARLGLAALPVGGFADLEVGGMLGLDPSEEGALVVVGLFAPEDLEVRPPRGSLALKGPILPVDPKDPSGQKGVMKALHWATVLKAPLVPASGRDAPGDAYREDARPGAVLSLPVAGVPMGADADKTILIRRSTRAFSAEAFTLDELARILHFAYGASALGGEDARLAPPTIDASLLETHVAWNRAEGGEPGIYYYRARSHELVLTNPGARDRECHGICLGQELGRDAAAVVFHTVDLPRAVARYGDRAYRYVHLDAGHLGERLNLAAIHLGLGASGIGGFFDDFANQLLGLPLRSAIVYPTCLGRPAEGVD
jgi:SagB-type dehydrogenase family enzyme